MSQALRSVGWSVDVAGPADVLDDLRHVVPTPPGVHPVALVRARRALAAVVDEYDLVHAHGLKVGWLATTVRPRPPVVLSIHNLVLDEVAGRAAPVLRVLEERLPARVDASIAISTGVAARFTGRRGHDRMHVVPPAGPPPVVHRPAQEVRRSLGVEPGEHLVVTAARLNPQKGLDVLVEAAAIARASRHDLRWVVFGEGPSRERLASDIAARGLEGVVVLAGPRPTVDDELAAADVVAVPSLWESGPLVVLEALALGRPVVSTRVGLAPDVVDSSNGRIVDVGDAAAFAGAVIDVIDDPPIAAGGLTGSDPRFAPDALVRAIESIYREVLDPR